MIGAHCVGHPGKDDMRTAIFAIIAAALLPACSITADPASTTDDDLTNAGEGASSGEGAGDDGAVGGESSTEEIGEGEAGDGGGGTGGTGDHVADPGPGGTIPDAQQAFGDACEANFECVSGICATPPDGAALCSRRCSMDGEDCPAGWGCRVVDFGAELLPLCWPAAETRCTDERCNGRDDDCDGLVDEDWPKLDVECDGDDADQCATGRFACAADGLSAVCADERVVDVIEACDGQDDDCDGVTDNGFEVGVACDAGFGACRRVGETICSPDGARTVCNVLPGAPELETCGDGVDNDCDGAIDEGYDVGATCDIGLGACARTGQMVCGADGTSLVCNVQAGEPREELCGDGIDNDCDGRRDEGFELGLPCQRGQGACSAVGELICSADGTGTTCDAEPLAALPIDLCGDGSDNDCDGDVDEGWNLGGECEVGLGACARRGLFECGIDGIGVRCSAEAGRPEAEACDGVDNDCDGEVDEDFDGCTIEGICIPPGARAGDGCGVCIPDVARDDWSDGCARQWQETTFEEFADGVREGAGRDLHVAHTGEMRLIHQLDTNRDGWPDLFFNHWQRGNNNRTDSFLYTNDPRGFSDIRVTRLLGEGSYAHDIADLDGDGWPELLVSNQYEGNSYIKVLQIYAGGEAGYDAARRHDIPMAGAAGIAVADLNSDGHLDIAVCSFRDNQTHNVSTPVFWGSDQPYHPDRMRTFPTRGCTGVAVADLDLDGHLDLIFANQYDNNRFSVNSYIYWGTEDGPASNHRAELPTLGARDVAVADLDKDGWPDLVFANNRDGGNYNVPTYVYYGSPAGYSVDDRDEIITTGTRSVSIADLDADGYLDLVLTSFYSDNSYERPSFIYWGTRFGFTADRRSTIPTVGATGSIIADLDGDGQLDITFSQHRSNNGEQDTSVWFAGGERPHGENGIHRLPAHNAEFGWSWEEGNVWDRSNRYVYRSSIWDAESPTIGGRLTWDADVPEHTRLKFQVRSAATRQGVEQAPWLGPDGAEDSWFDSSGQPLSRAHDGDQYYQYVTAFERDRSVAGPVLREVVLQVGPPGSD